MRNRAAFPGPGPLRRRPVAAALLAALTVVASAVVLRFGGSIEAATLPGFAIDLGWTPWLLPASRLAMQMAAVVTTGCVLAAVFLVPGRPAPEGVGSRLLLSPSGRRWVRAASYAASAWSLAALSTACFTLADLLGAPASQVVTQSTFLEAMVSVELGRVYLFVTALSAVVAVACRLVVSTSAGAAVLILALLTVAPPAFTGHAAGSTNHQLATSMMVLHVVAAVLWTGGLLALLLGRRRRTTALAASVRRFSSLALWCFVAIGVSGAVSAVERLSRWSDVLGSDYGRLILFKTAALIVLGGIGWWHRRVSLPGLVAGRRGVFARIGWIEALIMAATIGLAAGLSRTAPDREARPESLTGVGWRRLLDWFPEPLVLAAAVAGIAFYLVGVRRLHARGEHWPLGRTAVWITGWLVAVAASDLELAQTGEATFTLIQILQHLAVAAVVPVLLISGGGVTLAQRALRPATEAGMRGPREWLHLLLDAGPTRFLTQPAVALGLYAGGIFALFVSVRHVFPVSRHATHVVVFGTALAAGCLLFWLILGLQSTPEPLPAPVRRTLLLAALVLQALLGVGLTRTISQPRFALALEAAVAVFAAAIYLARRSNTARPDDGHRASDVPADPPAAEYDGLAPATGDDAVESARLVPR